MPIRPDQRRGLVRAARAAAIRLLRPARCLRRRLGRRVVVEVLSVDPGRRAAERALRSAAGSLRRALGDRFPAELAVLVQETVAGGPVGRAHRRRRPDGHLVVLVQLAARVGGRRLSTDELAAALADHLVALTHEPDGAAVSTGLGLVEPVDATLPPDPLALAAVMPRPDHSAA